MEEMNQIDRMIDFGIEEALITFNLGDPATEDDLYRLKYMFEQIDIEEIR